MGAKATFDTANRLIILTEVPVVASGETVGRVTFDIEIDGYSDGKEDWKANVGGNFRKHRFPFITAESAGDALPGGQVEPAFFRLRNNEGWRIQPHDSDHELTIIGNIVPGDATQPIFKARAGRTILIFRDGSQVAQMTSATVQTAVAKVPEIADVHGQLPRSVFINTELAPVGNGYQQTPFNNWTSAVNFAEANGLIHLELLADATVDRLLKNFVILGVGLPAIDLNGQIMDGTLISECSITGSYTGKLEAKLCPVVNLSGMDGSFFNISASGTLTAGINSILSISGVSPLIPNTPWTMDMRIGSASSALIDKSTDDVTITNMDNAGDVLSFHGLSGQLTIAASCTAGNIVASGAIKVINNAAGTSVDLSRVSQQIIFKGVLGAVP